MQIIKNRQISEDQWQQIAADADVSQLPAGNIIVPLALWQAHRELLLQRQGQLGIRLNGDNEVAEIAADLPRFSVIALQFPAFRDGRAYSMARMLRQHYGYAGELRAVGNVLRDQVGYMARIGFDAFEIDPKQDIEDALQAFGEISVKYQASSDEPLPIYRRRA
jgi:uncharacterized protein (DUF934 family)